MRRIAVSKTRTMIANVVAWGVVHAATGYAAHRLSPSVLRSASRWLRPLPFENDGHWYEEHLYIKRWKDRLPEAGDVFAGGLSKRRLPNRDDGGLDRFALETCRAELGHWLAALASPLFLLWNPPVAAALNVAYGVGVNVPFIAVQRYNRVRAERALSRRLAYPERSSVGSSLRADSRRECDTNGSSIPYGSPLKRWCT